jgi:hypothetical protein
MPSVRTKERNCMKDLVGQELREVNGVMVDVLEVC